MPRHYLGLCQAEKIISDWVKEHPKKTYLSELLEQFPNTPLSGNGTPVEICPAFLGLKNITNCGPDVSCEVCWNQEVKND